MFLAMVPDKLKPNSIAASEFLVLHHKNCSVLAKIIASQSYREFLCDIF